MQLDKFEGADFKYDNIFFKFRHFCFFAKFAIRQIWGCWFQIWQQFFEVPAQKYQYKAFLVPNLRIFIFALNFATRQIWGRYLKYDNNIFKFQLKNTQIKHFWSQNWGFLFYIKLCCQTNLRVFVSNMTMVLSNCSLQMPK